MHTRRTLCLFLLAVAPEKGVAGDALEVSVERLEIEALEGLAVCVVDTEIELESWWLKEGV